ncbi:hypothetical protein [Rhodoferax sp. U11-2br]|uniref:hypothetical protein n=1 Tax=Rhodoferax sp. U11-2br TaxID=2838878 RepID=UPI001BE5AE41|nr:hypothetical protein [Rhodoferax sp. U11-2br]MBT3068791.1 hypothetical protein [Rhodoferax sp. U11-2br]
MAPARSTSKASRIRQRTWWPGRPSATGALVWNPVASLRARFERWWQARLPASDSVTLTQRTVYILPTRAGWMLGATLLVLLLASINYQLNLGYLLTFLLAGCSLVAMHVSHANLRGITMNLITPEPVFAGARAIFDIQLLNSSQRTRPALALAIQGSRQWVYTDLAPLSQARVQLACLPGQRGLHPLPTVRAQTLFPLGSFCAVSIHNRRCRR